jgi:hypothetical protein
VLSGGTCTTHLAVVHSMANLTIDGWGQGAGSWELGAGMFCGWCFRSLLGRRCHR